MKKIALCLTILLVSNWTFSQNVGHFYGSEDGSLSTDIKIGKRSATSTIPHFYVKSEDGSFLNFHSVRWNGRYTWSRESDGNVDRKIAYLHGDGASSYFQLFNHGQEIKTQLSSNGHSFFNGGKVGIGTGTPSHLLEVRGKALFSNVGGETILLNPDGDNRQGIISSNFKMAFIADKVNTLGSDKKIIFGAGGETPQDASFQTYMMINQGKVGIGTENPDFPLHITGIDNGVKIGEGPNFLLFRDEIGGANELRSYGLDLEIETRNVTEDIHFKTDNGDRNLMTIKGTGNIGIGTSTPEEMLNVSGNVLISGGNKLLQNRSNVTSEHLLSSHGRGAGWMVNATYGGSGNPQTNATFTGDKGEYNMGSGYIDFDGNAKRWTINISGESTGVGTPVNYVRSALFDDTYIALSPRGNETDFHIDFNGNVGVGTSTPSTKLDIEGGDVFIGEEATSNGQRRQLRIYGYDNNDQYYGTIHSNWEEYRRTFDIYTNSSTNQLKIDASANSTARIGILPGEDAGVGIGTLETGTHKLAVEGSIGAREIKVEANGWSDFVFEEGYELRTLEEVEAHITENGHLPEIPSEAEVLEEGINLGEMNAKLLQKIEELTLYMIDMNKRVNQLEQENSVLNINNRRLQEQVNQLSKD